VIDAKEVLGPLAGRDPGVYPLGCCRVTLSKRSRQRQIEAAYDPMIHRYSSRRSPLKDFLPNQLQEASCYDRIAGFFSSSLLEVAAEAPSRTLSAENRKGTYVP
jgi:hypothetical protein